MSEEKRNTDRRSLLAAIGTAGAAATVLRRGARRATGSSVRLRFVAGGFGERAG